MKMVRQRLEHACQFRERQRRVPMKVAGHCPDEAGIGVVNLRQRRQDCVQEVLGRARRQM